MACSQRELEFRCLVYRVSEDLQREETNVLGFLYKLPEAEYKDKPTLEIFDHLQKRGIISATRPEGLIDVIKRINRMDLVKMIKEHYARPRKKCKDDTSALGDSTESEHFQVVQLQNLTMRSQLKLLERYVQEPEAKSAVKEAYSRVEDANMLLQRAESLESGSDKMIKGEDRSFTFN